jgi:hypothetical protein
MDELIKSITAAFTKYLLECPEFQERVEKIIGMTSTLTGADEEAIRNVVDERIDTKIEAFNDSDELVETIRGVSDDVELDAQKIRDVVRNMDFTIEVGRY